MSSGQNNRKQHTITTVSYARNGIIVRLIYLLIAILYYILSGFGRLFSHRSLVFCYHGISEKHKDRFGKQIAHMNKSKILKRNILITFDDAFENILENTLPVLEQYNIPAIIFAVAGNFGKIPTWKMAEGHPEYSLKIMTASQLAELSRNPLFKIGSHTLTHPYLSELSVERLDIELKSSKQEIESIIGYTVNDLALPYGSFNHTVLEKTKEAGYKRIYTLENKFSNSASGKSVIGRFSMTADMWLIEFIMTCAGCYTWLYPWRLMINQLRRLIKI